MNFRCEHPLREELHNELHARPSLYFKGDADVWHVAVMGRDGPPPLPSVFENLDDLATTQRGKHGIGGYAGGRLKWEAHTEFLTLTFVAEPEASSGRPPKPFRDLVDQVEGDVVAAVRVLVRSNPTDSSPFGAEIDAVASSVGGEEAELVSNFRLTKSGFVEFALINHSLNAYRTGRMVRRILEIETYRMMALLATPVAQETIGKIASFDRRVDQLIAHMQSATKIDKALLTEVTQLTSDVLNFSAVAKRRFGATKAYSELVNSRISDLREGRIQQRQRISTFIHRRFQPAIRSAEASERRLDELVERVALTGDLLRTTVQVQLEDQNASLLTSMEERARVQVHIQQAVEGLSVIAITYYTIGLVKVCLEGLIEFGLDPHRAKQLVIAAIPAVLWAVWKAVRHVRKNSWAPD